MLVTLIPFAVFPFFFANSDYVFDQYRALGRNFADCATVPEYDYADISGIYRTLGADLPPIASQAIRIVAGGVTMVLWWIGARRLGKPKCGLWLFTLMAAYLMLFNPMNEANSYVILAPALGLWAMVLLKSEKSEGAGFFIGFIALSMGLFPNLVRPLFGNSFAKCWHPIMTFVFVGLLIRFAWADRNGAGASRNEVSVPTP